MLNEVIVPDFSEASESKSTPVPDGVYKVRVTDCEKKESKAGNSYLNWKLTIFGADGEYAKQNNRPVFHRTMLSGKGAGMLKDFLRVIDVDASKGFNPETCLGRELEVTLASRIDQSTGLTSPWPDVRAVKPLRQ